MAKLIRRNTGSKWVSANRTGRCGLYEGLLVRDDLWSCCPFYVGQWVQSFAVPSISRGHMVFLFAVYILHVGFNGIGRHVLFIYCIVTSSLHKALVRNYTGQIIRTWTAGRPENLKRKMTLSSKQQLCEDGDILPEKTFVFSTLLLVGVVPLPAPVNVLKQKKMSPCSFQQKMGQEAFASLHRTSLCKISRFSNALLISERGLYSK